MRGYEGGSQKVTVDFRCPLASGTFFRLPPVPSSLSIEVTPPIPCMLWVEVLRVDMFGVALPLRWLAVASTLLIHFTLASRQKVLCPYLARPTLQFSRVSRAL
jgi:hypothetical protein